MFTMLFIFLVTLCVATGLGTARNNRPEVENSTWAGFSRSRAKKYFRSRGLVLRAGQLAAIMADEHWASQPLCGKKNFVSVPREGRANVGVAGEKPLAGGVAKKAFRVVTTRAAVAAKRQRDLAASAARPARKAERSSNRAHAKGVWAARLKAERAAWVRENALRPRLAPPIRPLAVDGWATTVRSARGPQGLIALARGTSFGHLHEAADQLEIALAEQAGAVVDFAKARARVTVRWAAADLREELLAA